MPILAMPFSASELEKTHACLQIRLPGFDQLGEASIIHNARKPKP